MRRPIVDGDVRSLMAQAAPGDVLLRASDTLRVGTIIGPADNMEGFHVSPWDKGPATSEFWGCSIRLVKLTR